MKQRVAWIDWSKSILIFLMVLGHNNLPYGERTWIYGFHMPAFYIISGYLYKPKNWKHTILSFLVPVLFFSLVRLGFYVLNRSLKGNMVWDYSLLERCLLPFLKSNVANEVTLFSGVWFIACLLMCRLLCGDISMKLSIRYICFLSVPSFVFMCIEESLPYVSFLKEWFVYRTLACLPFFSLGLIWKHYGKGFFTKNVFVILGLLILYGVIVSRQGYIEMYSGDYGYNYAVFYFAAVCGSFALFSITTYFRENNLSKVYSIGTLLILGLHKLMINIFAILGGHYLLNEILASTIYSLLIMILCYYPIRICNKKMPILLGK